MLSWVATVESQARQVEAIVVQYRIYEFLRMAVRDNTNMIACSKGSTVNKQEPCLFPSSPVLFPLFPTSPFLQGNDVWIYGVASTACSAQPPLLQNIRNYGMYFHTS